MKTLVFQFLLEKNGDTHDRFMVRLEEMKESPYHKAFIDGFTGGAIPC